MKTPILDIINQIIYKDEEKPIYLMTFKFGVLKLRIKLTNEDLMYLIKSILNQKNISFKTEIECQPLSIDRRRNYLEITNKTFNPRMIDE